MGVKNLWPHIQSLKTTISLIEWSMKKREELGGQIPIIGVDANIYILAGPSTRHEMHKDGAIGTVLSVLCKYGCGQSIMVFVFDGPKAAKYKTSKTARRSIPFHEKSKMLIRAFGGFILEAPAEADAQLSCMSDHGILDAMISDDSDMVIRGISTVLRFNQEKTSTSSQQEIYFDEYDAKTLKQDPGFQLTRGGLLLAALLVGSDYAAGIQGCGMKTAVHLSQLGYGDTLRNGLLSMSKESPKVVQKFLKAWKENTVADLKAKVNVDKRTRSMAEKIAAAKLFPSPKAIQGYLQQEHTQISPHARVDTSRPFHVEHFSHSIHHSHPPSASSDLRFGPQLISVEDVTKFCRFQMQWSLERIVSYFQKALWKPVVMQMLISPFVGYDGQSLTTGMPTNIKTLHQKVLVDSVLTVPATMKVHSLDYVRIRLNPNSLQSLVTATIPRTEIGIQIPATSQVQKTIVYLPKNAMPWFRLYPLSELSDTDSSSSSDDEITYLYTTKTNK
ncbi:hypothetical protein V5O48_015879 [Marasmius crinis-equi]|uniref:XPG-I domain-containing protein n=1 Tax=Marasmius crinis-equi TaxID=585013 RepID=A0ABR3ET89_9AGAR